MKFISDEVSHMTIGGWTLSIKELEQVLGGAIVMPANYGFTYVQCTSCGKQHRISGSADYNTKSILAYCSTCGKKTRHMVLD